ncbi:MAG TPA: methyltransferase domain-containing protein [Stellaceae bacterium]
MADSSPALLFDRRAWRLHRVRAQRQGVVDFLHREVGERLTDRLDLVNRKFPTALDLSAAALDLGGTAWAVSREVVSEPDFVPFRDASFDLVASNLLLHWVGDLPGTLVQLRRVLKPGGLLLATLFGGQTLVELRTALFEAELAEEGGVSPRVSPTMELGDAAALLQRAGFSSPVADSETITVTYPDILGLMRDLRGMGETNALSARRGFLRRATLARADAIYGEHFAAADGRIPATFEVLFLTGWAPHPDDTNPRPGPRRAISQH